MNLTGKKAMYVKIMTSLFAIRSRSLAIVIVMFICHSCFPADVFKPEYYVEVDVKILKATPENYRNKKIFYESEYKGFKTEFPQYLEKEGFKSTKKYWLEIMPDSIPVFADKSDEMNKIVPGLKRDSAVKVYGEIKKISLVRKKGEQGPVFSFYLDLDHIEVISDPPEKKGSDEFHPQKPENREGDRKTDSKKKGDDIELNTPEGK